MPTRSMASFLRRWGHHGCLLLQWHGLLRRHRRVHRSAFARDHAWHGVAAICRSRAMVPMPCFQSCHSGSQQVRLLRVLMPQEGSYIMDELCYLLILHNKYTVAVNTGSCHLDANYALLDSLTMLSDMRLCCACVDVSPVHA